MEVSRKQIATKGNILKRNKIPLLINPFYPAAVCLLTVPPYTVTPLGPTAVIRRLRFVPEWAAVEGFSGRI